MACCILYGMLYGMLYGCGVAIEAYSIQLPNSTVLHSNKLCPVRDHSLPNHSMR